MEKEKESCRCFQRRIDTSFTVMYLAKEKGYEVYTLAPIPADSVPSS